MKQKHILIITTLFLATLTICPAETIDAASFFKLPVGAKPISCGGAYNAVSGDVNSIYYNPAGLSSVRKTEFTSMVGLLSLDRNLNALAVVFPANFGVIGFGILNAGVGKISKYSSDAEKEGEFDYQANCVLISYGKNLLQQTSFGSNLKIVFDNLDDYSRYGFAVDLGVISDIKDNLSIGAKIQNLIGVIGKDYLPLGVVLGVKYNIIEPLCIVCDANYNLEFEQFKLNFGVQYHVAELLYLACGLYNKEVSFGIGFNIFKFNIYYAFSTDQFNENNLHFLSLGIKF